MHLLRPCKHLKTHTCTLRTDPGADRFFFDELQVEPSGRIVLCHVSDAEKCQLHDPTRHDQPAIMGSMDWIRMSAVIQPRDLPLDRVNTPASGIFPTNRSLGNAERKDLGVNGIQTLERSGKRDLCGRILLSEVKNPRFMGEGFLV